MEYSIGEVADLLNVSRDMIRYYEKQGAIRSGRNAANNYRSYDTMEVFWLLEAMQHKSWGIPISEISEIRRNEYSWSTERFLREEAAKMKEDASYKELLAGRLLELRKYMLLGMRNIGNYWVDHVEAEYRCQLVTGHGDEYDRIGIAPESSRFLFSDRYMPFIDNALTADGARIKWEMSIREKYLSALPGPIPDTFFQVPERLCLCTNADIGEIGHFDASALAGLREYADRRGYKVHDGQPVRGILLGRGFEGGHFHRIVRLMLPVD